MQKTKNYGFIKPDPDEYYDVQQFNSNMDAIDDALYGIAETTETTMPNSCEGRLLFKEIRGKTEKLTSTGKNVLDASKVVDNKFQNCGSGFGVTNSTSFFISGLNEVKENTIYTCSHKFSTAVFYSNENTPITTSYFTDGTQFTTPSGSKYVNVCFSKSIVSLGANIMINEGTTALPYEPYGVGTPFFRSAVISGIKTHGNNLFDYSKATNEYITNDGEIAYHPYVIMSGYIRSNGNVTVSVNKSVTAIAINCFDVDKGFVSKNVYQNCSVAKLEAVENCAYIRVAITADSSDLDISRLLTYEPMVNEGDIALPYEPYNVVTFSNPIELNEIGDVQDVIVDGKTIRRVNKPILNGSESGWVYSGNNLFYLPVNSLVKKDVYTDCMMCDAYEVVANHTHLTNYGISGYGDQNNTYPNQNWIYVKDVDVSDLASFKAKLQANPMTVVYELATPTFDILPTADQVALNSIKTFDGTTYLEFDSPLQPEFVAEYGTSKVGGVSLESLLVARNNDIRISTLETAIVNNI